MSRPKRFCTVQSCAELCTPAMMSISRLSVCLSLCALAAAAGTTTNIAVIGAGPHGVTAALELKQREYNVTIFEKETVLLPIINSVQIGTIVYEHLGQALLPSATPAGSTSGSTRTSPSALSDFAQKYGQPLEPLLAAVNTLSFNSAAGVNPVPSSWLPFLADASGRVELLEELAEGYALLLELRSYSPSPAGVLESGVAAINQTFADWAQGFGMPAFTDFIELVFNSALSGPVSETIAANILSPSGLYIPGGLRQIFLLQGIKSSSPEAQAANLTDLLQGDPTPAAINHLPNGVRALFAAAVGTEGVNVQLETPVTSVTNDEMVTYERGQQKFASVIVTVRPAAARAMLPAPLADVYTGARTGLIDLWIFNATALANATNLAGNLETPFLGFVTNASSITPADGVPAYTIKLDENLPIVCVGSHVMPNISEAQSTAVARDTLMQYGLNVSSVIECCQVEFSSALANSPQTDQHDNIYVLGEVFSSIGIVTALEYVPSRISEWFDISGNAIA